MDTKRQTVIYRWRQATEASAACAKLTYDNLAFVQRSDVQFMIVSFAMFRRIATGLHDLLEIENEAGQATEPLVDLFECSVEGMLSTLEQLEAASRKP